MHGRKNDFLMLINSTLLNIGVFLLVAGGIVAGFFLLAIEIAFKRFKEKQEKENEISRSALMHWRKSVEVNRIVILSVIVNEKILRQYDLCAIPSEKKTIAWRANG